MTSKNTDDTYCCLVCEKKNNTMKRCTQCRKVYYCSRECQVQDWPEHRQQCQKAASAHVLNVTDIKTRHLETKESFTTDDGSIFTEKVNNQQDPSTSQAKHHTSIDFQKAATELKNNRKDVKIEGRYDQEQKSLKDDTMSQSGYLMYDQYYSDLPVLDESQPYSDVVIKANKEKQTLSIQNSWNGTEIYKVLSYKLQIPLDKIKVIHKGKVLNPQTILPTIKNKALFQVIGEQAASEEGLDGRDITCIMKQLSISRNDAVQALRKTGNVIDAIMEVGNK